jgi:hypothetical protein
MTPTATVAAGVSCPRCRERSAHQIYIIQGELGEYAYDVGKARVIVSDGRLPHVIPPEVLRRFLDLNKDWDAVHCDHVDPGTPGIVGQRFGGLALFDGTHRAARALRDGQEFSAFMLSYPESAACMILCDPAEDMSLDTIVAEVRGLLVNNPGAEMVEVGLECEETEDTEELETAIRMLLTEEENARIACVFNRRN